jgi:hypothetical protein
MLQQKALKDTIKIGILLPQSKEYPKLAKEFLDGIKLYFSIHENNFSCGKVELIVEDIGFGTERASLEKTRKLLTLDEVTIIAGLMEFNTAIKIGEVAEIMDVPVLIGGLGETKIDVSKVPDNLYFHSFMLWQSLFELGKYVGKHFPEDHLSVITSLFDVGYDSYRAFFLGLKSSASTEHTLFISKAYDGDELLEDLAVNFPLNKEHNYCLLLHPKLLNGLLKKAVLDVSKVIVTPFSTHYKGEQYSSFVSLSNSSATYVEFSEGISDYFSVQPSVHHALGYQQGQLLYSAVKNLKSHTDDASSIYDAWDGFNEETVTGLTTYSSTSRHFESDFYISKRIDESQLDLEKRDSVKIMESEIEDLLAAKNSYTNPYLFM